MKQITALSASSSHHTISYQGGGDYRGIYDIGLKRGFMGYRGLLLNDPYKRDRIDGWLLDIFLLCTLFFFVCFFLLAILTWGFWGIEILEIWRTRVLGMYMPFIDCPLIEIV
jgi:hypothetical protein